MDGYAVARELRSDPATAAARLICLSGFGGEEAAGRARGVGFDVVLVKPVDPAELDRAIGG
jgi:CheY-like chemotaxis protein